MIPRLQPEPGAEPGGLPGGGGGGGGGGGSLSIVLLNTNKPRAPAAKPGRVTQA
jgi:hypothetical protein